MSSVDLSITGSNTELIASSCYTIDKALRVSFKHIDLSVIIAAFSRLADA